MAIVLNDQHDGFDQVEVVAIPQIGRDDPPPADQPAVRRHRHGAAAADGFGSRTKW